MRGCPSVIVNLNFQLSSETDEALGPLETPYPSLAFQRNFSLTLNYWRDLFNVHFSPHSMVAWRPTDPVLPSDAKFKGSSFGFRPIGYDDNNPLLVVARSVIMPRARKLRCASSSRNIPHLENLTEFRVIQGLAPVVPAKSSPRHSAATILENNSLLSCSPMIDRKSS